VKISEHNGAVYKDSDSNPWVLGKCECNLEIERVIADAVLKGLSELDNVFCAVFASALDTVIETGAGPAILPINYFVLTPVSVPQG
jgi:hypothetical protein